MKWYKLCGVALAAIVAVAIVGPGPQPARADVVEAWGYNYYGQLGDGTTTNRLTPVPVSGLSGITSIAAGNLSSYALSADGSLWVWRDNEYGELGLGDTVNRLSPEHLLPPTGYRFTSIAAGPNADHALATLAPIPEPSTLALLGMGAVGLLAYVRRTRKP